MQRFAEEQREKRRMAKEQWQADKLKREQEKPLNNHRKNLRKNVLKLVDKEASELNREDFEDKLETISHADMEALWTVLSDRGSRTVADCVIDAMADFGAPLVVPKSKKNKNGKSETPAAKKAVAAKAELTAPPARPVQEEQPAGKPVTAKAVGKQKSKANTNAGNSAVASASAGQSEQVEQQPADDTSHSLKQGSPHIAQDVKAATSISPATAPAGVQSVVAPSAVRAAPPEEYSCNHQDRADIDEACQEPLVPEAAGSPLQKLLDLLSIAAGLCKRRGKAHDS